MNFGAQGSIGAPPPSSDSYYNVNIFLVLSRMTIERFWIGFIRLFDTARDYTLQFTITHTLVSTVTSSLAVAR
jgi:hypothetical protein